MGKSITGVLLVLGGAVAGCAGFGILFGIVAAVTGHPSFAQAAVLFALTFGLFGGVGIAMMAFERFIGESNFAVLALPGLVALALMGIAILLLFSDGIWSTMFGGSGVVPYIVPWVLIVTWAGNRLNKKK